MHNSWVKVKKSTENSFTLYQTYIPTAIYKYIPKSGPPYMRLMVSPVLLNEVPAIERQNGTKIAVCCIILVVLTFIASWQWLLTCYWIQVEMVILRVMERPSYCGIIGPGGNPNYSSRVRRLVHTWGCRPPLSWHLHYLSEVSQSLTKVQL